MDINECSSDVCSENANCENTVGSYICMCKSGYARRNLTGCSGKNIHYCIKLPFFLKILVFNLLFLPAEYFKTVRILNFLKHWRSSTTRLKINLVIFILINLTIFAGNWIHFSYYSTLSKRKKFFKILRKQFFEEKQIVYFRKITLQYPLLRYQRVCYRRWCLWR